MTRTTVIGDKHRAMLKVLGGAVYTSDHIKIIGL